MASKSTDWRPGPTVCRCCLSEGCYKDISTEYFWMGKREVYSEMLLESFNLSIAYSQSGGPNSNSRLICEPCISRLRDATEFKRQVQECEKTFMQYLDPGSSAINEMDAPLDNLDSQVKVEEVKLEKQLSDDDFDDQPDFGDDDDDDDLDDQPLTKFATKVPKKESVDLLDLLDNAKATEKRKSSSKTKSTPAKKAKMKKDTVKATSSKAIKPEKKKKEPVSHIMAKRNAEVVLQYSTAYPFRLQGNNILCVYCCESYQDPEEYREHMDSAHQNFTVSTAFAHCARRKDYLKVDLTGLKCRLCAKPQNNINDMAKHICEWHKHKHLDLDYDIGMQPYKMEKGSWECCLCNIKLPSLVKLGRHTAAHYQKFTCDICGRNYNANEALKYHVKLSHSGKHTCRKCWQEFSNPDERKEHLKVSKQCWSYCCVICGERFMSWENKQKHLTEVHGYAKKVYECPGCDKIFDSRKHFYKHYKLFHTDDSIICSCCGLKFANKRELDDHRIGHTGEKGHKCTICFKSFARERSLKRHMWIHSEHKRFTCLMCNKQFVQKVSLKSHLKSHHPDINILNYV